MDFHLSSTGFLRVALGLAKKIRNTKAKIGQKRVENAVCRTTASYFMSAGHFSSSMEKYFQRPPSPSAQEGCFRLANKNYFRRVSPQIHSRPWFECLYFMHPSSNLRIPTTAGFLLIFSFFFIGRIFFRPVSILGVPVGRRRLPKLA